MTVGIEKGDKTMKRIIMICLALFMVLAGCGQAEVSSAGSNIESSELETSSMVSSSAESVVSQEASSEPEIITQYTYDEGCVFIRNKDQGYGVLTDGREIPASSEYESEVGVYRCQSVTVQVYSNGKEEIIGTSEQYKTYNIASWDNREEAPQKFVQYILESYMNTGWHCAISDYKINDIQVESGLESGSIIFTVNYTITPAPYAISFKTYQYTSGKADQESLTITQRITLVEYYKGWYSYTRDTDLIYPYLKESQDYGEYEDRTVLLYETDRFTYTFIRTYAEEQDPNDLPQFIGTLERYDKTNGSVYVVWRTQTVTMGFLAQYGDDIYFYEYDCGNFTWFDCGFICISEKNGEVIETKEYLRCAVTDEYICCGNYNDDSQLILYVYSMKEKKFVHIWEDAILSCDDTEYTCQCIDGILMWYDFDYEEKWHHFNIETGVDIMTNTYWEWSREG